MMTEEAVLQICNPNTEDNFNRYDANNDDTEQMSVLWLLHQNGLFVKFFCYFSFECMAYIIYTGVPDSQDLRYFLVVILSIHSTQYFRVPWTNLKTNANFCK